MKTNKKHKTQRTDIEQMREMFKDFNEMYKEMFLILKPTNQTNNENN